VYHQQVRRLPVRFQLPSQVRRSRGGVMRATERSHSCDEGDERRSQRGRSHLGRRTRPGTLRSRISQPPRVIGITAIATSKAVAPGSSSTRMTEPKTSPGAVPKTKIPVKRPPALAASSDRAHPGLPRRCRAGSSALAMGRESRAHSSGRAGAGQPQKHLWGWRQWPP
jgi:hypothetical protein